MMRKAIKADDRYGNCIVSFGIGSRTYIEIKEMTDYEKINRRRIKQVPRNI